MKQKYYILVQTLMNGTIPIKSDYSIYPSVKLAEEVVKKLKEVNKGRDSFFDCKYQIVEADIYETENDVPVLNNNLNLN